MECLVDAPPPGAVEQLHTKVAAQLHESTTDGTAKMICKHRLPSTPPSMPNFFYLSVVFTRRERRRFTLISSLKCHIGELVSAANVKGKSRVRRCRRFTPPATGFLVLGGAGEHHFSGSSENYTNYIRRRFTGPSW